MAVPEKFSVYCCWCVIHTFDGRQQWATRVDYKKGIYYFVFFRSLSYLNGGLLNDIHAYSVNAMLWMADSQRRCVSDKCRGDRAVDSSQSKWRCSPPDHRSVDRAAQMLSAADVVRVAIWIFTRFTNGFHFNGFDVSFAHLFIQFQLAFNECLIDRRRDCVRALVSDIKMLFGFVAYVKNRRVGSTYPSINAKPTTKTLKTEKRRSVSSLAKLVKLEKLVNVLPLLRCKDSIITGNVIELKGTCIVHCSFQSFSWSKNRKRKKKKKRFGYSNSGLTAWLLTDPYRNFVWCFLNDSHYLVVCGK